MLRKQQQQQRHATPVEREWVETEARLPRDGEEPVVNWALVGALKRDVRAANEQIRQKRKAICREQRANQTEHADWFERKLGAFKQRLLAMFDAQAQHLPARHAEHSAASAAERRGGKAAAEVVEQTYARIILAYDADKVMSGANVDHDDDDDEEDDDDYDNNGDSDDGYTFYTRRKVREDVAKVQYVASALRQHGIVKALALKPYELRARDMCGQPSGITPDWSSSDMLCLAVPADEVREFMPTPTEQDLLYAVNICMRVLRVPDAAPGSTDYDSEGDCTSF